MGTYRFRSALVAPLAYGLAAAAEPSPRIDFEARVAAQSAIERVYYSHREGTKRPFELALTRQSLERKVRRYLALSRALDDVWQTPVTAEALGRELERIAGRSQLPERLEEVYAALGHDRSLIEECLVRPVLVERVALSFFSADRRIHAAALSEANALRDQLTGRVLDRFAEHPRRVVVEYGRETHQPAGPALPDLGSHSPSARTRPPRIDLDHEAFEARRSELPEAGRVGPVVDDPEAYTISAVLVEGDDTVRVAVWAVPKRPWEDWLEEVSAGWDLSTFASVRVGSGPPPLADRVGSANERFTNTVEGSTTAVCGPDHTWDNGSLSVDGRLPQRRDRATAVWTGSEMIVWGGHSASGLLDTGGRYDPLTDSWRQLSATGAPSARINHTTIWTGSEMIVWGGIGLNSASMSLDSGGRYDPVTDAWSPIATSGAPAGRSGHTAVWSGSEMVVWGGDSDAGGSPFAAGGRYDPANDFWSPTATLGAPFGRSSHTAVWAGREMIVWGGYPSCGYCLGYGGRYDPQTDTWTSTSTSNAPAGRVGHTAVWTGTEMVVWGGDDYPYYFASGGRYDPRTDTWSLTSTSDAPAPRAYHTAVWTGVEMIVWGGYRYPDYIDTGGRYDPRTDTWTSTAISNAPSGRGGHTTVWSGSEMLVWGGFENSSSPNWFATGGRYAPSSDVWADTSNVEAPPARYLHTAVMAGNAMIVWGGLGPYGYHDDGGRYLEDSVTDAA